MTWNSKLASAVATVALAGALPMTSAAQQKPAQASTTAKSQLVEHVTQGSIVTMTDTSMVVRVKKGKDLTLALNGDTEKVGDIGSGKRVTVHYRNVKGQQVATSIQQSVTPQDTAAAKSKNN
jgi:hypothetical protein